MLDFLNELATVVITMVFHVLIFGLVYLSDPNLAYAYLAFISLKAYQSFMKIVRYKAALRKIGSIDLGNGIHKVDSDEKKD